MDGGDRSISQLRSPDVDRSGSPTNRIPLSVKSLSLLNIEQLSELRRRHTLANTVWKRGPQFDDGNSDEPKSTRPYPGCVARKVLGCKEVWKVVREVVRPKEVWKEVWKGEAQFDDKLCDLPKPKRVR